MTGHRNSFSVKTTAFSDHFPGSPASDGTNKPEKAQAADIELVAKYRPIGIAAVAAAFALR